MVVVGVAAVGVGEGHAMNQVFLREGFKRSRSGSRTGSRTGAWMGSQSWSRSSRSKHE